MKHRGFVLGGLTAALAIVVIVCLRERRDAPTADPPQAHEPQTLEQTRHPAPTLERSPVETADAPAVSPPSGTTKAPPPQPAGAAIPVTPNSVFEAKYPDATKEVLYNAKQATFKRYSEQTNKAIEDQYRAGVYEERHPDAAGVWPSVGSGADDPITGWKRLDTSKGDILVIQLPYDQYPELYEMKDELAWLDGKMRQLARR